MSWWNEGPLSGMWGGSANDSRSSAQSGALRGARMGAAGGPAGMAFGALAGWWNGRRQEGRIADASQRMANDASNRAAQGVDWGIKPDSPLAQFSDAWRLERPTDTPTTGIDPSTVDTDGWLNEHIPGTDEWLEAAEQVDADAPRTESGGGWQGAGRDDKGNSGWSGVMGRGANGETLIRGVAMYGSGGAGGSSKFYNRDQGSSSAQ